MEDGSHPLFRVVTFGHFALYRQCSQVQSPEEVPSYELIAEKVWRSRTAACSLLKLLLCRIRRRAPRDILIEALWPDVPVSNANHNFDTAVSLLRSLLRPDGQESLLTTIHSSSTTIYELPPQSLFWVDNDEFLAHVALSEQAEEQGGDPLPHFEAAWQIGKHVFLEDELYCEWAQTRRQTINITRHRILHRLADVYLQRNKRDQAETLLLKALEEEPADEDSAYRLMVLLEQQGRKQEALRCYERLVVVLKEESEMEPLPSTWALAERLRTASLTPALTSSSNVLGAGVDIHISASSHGIFKSTLFTLTVPLTAGNTYGQPSSPVEEQASNISTPKSYDCILWMPQETLSDDLLYRIMKGIYYWIGREGFQYSLQMTIDRLIKEYDTMEQQYGLAEGQLSRRDALMIIAGLPLTLVVKMQAGLITSTLLEEFLAQCTASIAICWRLLKGTDLHQVEMVLSRYLPVLDRLAYQPSKHQKSIASLAAQGHFLAATLTLHQNNLLAREAHCKQAVQLGQLAEDINLHMTALKWLAVTYYYAKSPLKALQTYQEIEPSIDRLSPLLRGSVYIKMASTYAQCGREQEALRCVGMAQEIFPEHPEQDPCFLYADCGRLTLPLWEGFAYLELGQPKEARSALERVEKLPSVVVSERGRVEALTHKAEAAVVLGDQELFRTYIEMSVNRAKALGSEKRYNEALDIYRQARRTWQNESKVMELQDLFAR